jgi:hypothetical protein
MIPRSRTYGDKYTGALTAVVTTLLIACGSAVPPAQLAAQAASPSTSIMFVEWSHSYTDLASLKKDSDLAVVGTIASVLDRPDVPKTATPYSLYSVAVSQAIYDPRAVATSTMKLYQLGGTIEGHPIMAERDPLYQIGDRVILFLKHGNADAYGVLGGPTGRFLVGQDGTVQPVVPNGVAVQPGTRVSQFVTMVQNA